MRPTSPDGIPQTMTTWRYRMIRRCSSAHAVALLVIFFVSGASPVWGGQADVEQRKAACVQQTNALLAVFDTDAGCGLTRVQLRELAAKFATIKTDVCGESKSFYDDPGMNLYQITLARDQKCGSRQTPQATARLRAFVASAANRGVEASQISQAILEGRFVPSLDELRGVATELGPNFSIVTQEWNRQFGSMTNLGAITTVQNGEWVRLTGKDLHYAMCLEGTQCFPLRRSYGLNQLVDTYDKAVAHLARLGVHESVLEAALARTTASVYEYFIQQDPGSGKLLRLGDYQLLQRAAISGRMSVPPKQTKYVRPEYPADAKRAGIQGVVVVSAVVEERGKVILVRVVESIPALDQAAVDAVRQWEFTPLRQEYKLTLRVTFSIQ